MLLRKTWSPIVAYVGRLDQQKGMHLVHHALFYALASGAQFVGPARTGLPQHLRAHPPDWQTGLVPVLLYEQYREVLARARHASVRSLERYARPGPEAVARHVAGSDPAARQRPPAR